jgi:hypothetical protein
MFKIHFGLDKKNPEVITYKTMRRMIGILGMALPVVLFLWSVCLTRDHFLLDSISSYYHTNRRDLFVGILCAVSFFLFSYHGYSKLDFFIFKIASFSALCVALFPAFIKSPETPYIHIGPKVSEFTNTVHYISAFIFFVTLAFVSLFLFTQRHPHAANKPVTPRKRIRNRVYIVCGIVILACILCMIVLNFLPETSAVFKLDPVFWVETVALFAFAFSWLLKGEVFLKDK